MEALIRQQMAAGPRVALVPPRPLMACLPHLLLLRLPCP